MLKPLLRKIKNRLFPKTKFKDNLEYWEDRTKKYGARSVLNLTHTAEELEEMNRYQMEQTFPLLKQELKGNEGVILDFGCGPGRFTPHLAELIEGKAIGVDPIQGLLDLAPTNGDTIYQKIQEGKIPLAANSVDVVWVCLVLGGIKEENLVGVKQEIERVLRPGGILCLSENTSMSEDKAHWYFRPEKWYMELFPFANLEKKGSYTDAGLTISVMIGKKTIA